MSLASSVWAALALSASLPQLPPRRPQFTVSQQLVPLAGSRGAYALPVHVLRDVAADLPAGGVVVATWTERTSFLVQEGGAGLGELNLLAPTPALAPRALPRLERYGWAWLFGAKATTVSWLDCCGVTGDESGYAFTPAGDTVTLTQWQRWLPGGSHAGRDAYSEHNFTLAWDATYGYTVEVAARLRINAAAAPATVEFLNFLVPHLANPWPAAAQWAWGGVPPSGAPLPAAAGPWPAPRAAATLWRNASGVDAFTGFAENLLAGAQLGLYAPAAAPAPRDGLLLMAARGAQAPGIAFAVAASAGASFAQQTCPTWADQHQILRLPAAGADGFVDVTPSFSLRWAPPRAAAHALDGATLLHAAGGAAPSPPPPRWYATTILRCVGAVETFEAQPRPLTAAERGFVAQRGAADYAIAAGAGVGVNGSAAAWRVPARAEASAAADPYAYANQQPLVPLNASAPYTLAAWLKLLPNASEALLWAGLFEADDFNHNISTGPTFGRLAYMNSSRLGGAGGGALWTHPSVAGGAPALRRAPAARAGADGWALLSIAFQSPPWPSYIDLRVLVFGTDGGAALVDDISLMQQ